MTTAEPRPVAGATLAAIERTRRHILLASAPAVVVMFAAPFVAPPSAVVVAAAIVLISLEKATVRYMALGRERDRLRDASRLHP